MSLKPEQRLLGNYLGRTTEEETLPILRELKSNLVVLSIEAPLL